MQNHALANWTRPLLLGAALSFFLVAPSVALAVDTDCDGIEDGIDLCPDKFDPDQGDIDGDLAGDRCDPDKDGDDVANDVDNCPRDANAAQDDTDGDGVGDACDQCAEDAGGEPVNRHGCTIAQLCPCDGPDDDALWRSHGAYVRCVKKAARKFALHEWITSDDRRAIVIAAKESDCGIPLPAAGDNDGDGVPDAGDNCPSDSNPSQKNTDADLFGDACDSDKDNDTVLNDADNCPVLANADGQASDADSDTVGDACDACSGTASGDVVDRDGCSIDQACPCELDEDGNPWGSNTRYRRCVKDEVFRFRLHRLVNADEADAINAEAAASDCGDRPPVCE